MSKKEMLREALQEFKDCQNVTNAFKLIRTSYKVLQPDAGLVWKEVMEVAEEVCNESTGS